MVDEFELDRVYRKYFLGVDEFELGRVYRKDFVSRTKKNRREKSTIGHPRIKVGS